MQNSNLTTCFWCGALVPNGEGPIHKYMLAAPGCWKLYGEILAKEYDELDYDPGSHRITVDTYAVTHPGRKEDRRAIQSVNIHLIRMYYQFEKNISGNVLLKIIKDAAENTQLHKSFTWLEPPSFTNTLHVTDIATASSMDDHKSKVSAWGLSVWAAWKEKYGDKIRAMADKLRI